MASQPISQRLRHRIDIQAPAVEQDPDTGAVVDSWASILGANAGKLPAEIVPMSGREFVASSATQVSATHRLTIRWRDGVHPRMRAVHRGDIYDIKAVLPDPSLQRHMTLMCDVGVNHG